MKNITVIGAGTMGNGIAHVFAQNGFQVSLVDISENALQKALTSISNNLDRMLAKEKISQEEKEGTLERIQTFTAIEKGIANADLVVEAATENLLLKKKIFSQL